MRIQWRRSEFAPDNCVNIGFSAKQVLHNLSLLVVTLIGLRHPLIAQQPTTWWPDPKSGVMWMSSLLGPTNRLNYAKAQDRCTKATTGGYNDWRLPTKEEMESAVITYSFDDYEHGSYQGTFEATKLKFFVTPWPLWTSTPASQDEVYVKCWTPVSVPYVANKRTWWGGCHTSSLSAQVICVRSMEPAVLELATEAHPATPVTGIPQLKSIALLVQAEDALAGNQFDIATSTAQQALALDPKSLRALDDIGVAEAYAGNWSDALSNLQTAHKLDKNFPVTNMDLNWVETFQKQAATDPKAKQAWILVHDADVAQSSESYEDAVASANQVITSEPDWPEGYDRLGLALGGLDQWQDAITALEKAVSLDKHGTTNAKQDLKNAKEIQKKEQKKK